jgi:hypothetical protein
LNSHPCSCSVIGLTQHNPMDSFACYVESSGFERCSRAGRL